MMTVGVYGLVAGIVKLDDLGMMLKARAETAKSGLAALQGSLGKAILLAAPWLMKALSVAGTVAMFLVGGGILAHALPALHHFVEHRAPALREIAVIGPVLAVLLSPLLDFVVGIIAGSVVLAAWSGVKRLKPGAQASH